MSGRDYEWNLIKIEIPEKRIFIIIKKQPEQLKKNWKFILFLKWVWNLISSNIKPMHQVFLRRLVVSLFSVFLEYLKQCYITSNKHEHYNCFKFSTLHLSMCFLSFGLQTNAFSNSSSFDELMLCHCALNCVQKLFVPTREKSNEKRMKEKRFNQQAIDRQIKLQTRAIV